MQWHDGVRCPVCGSKSEVGTGRPPDRYRQCLNRKCGKSWRTVEVLKVQANEMISWYTETVEKKGAGWPQLIEAALTMYVEAQRLAAMLGLVQEEQIDAASG